MIDMIITEHKNCTGCAACADICPKKCITMNYDAFGFLYPQIDESICIDCKKCLSECPSNNNVHKNDILTIYKGYAKNIESEANQKSTSGAMFGVLAQWVISCDGFVVGAAFDDDFQNVSHIICKTAHEIDKCRGSKYIQSKTQGIYEKTKELLNSNKPVLFSGTPCQIAALKSYLRTVPDNLITADFVCHGVGSTTFYQKYLKAETKGKNISFVGFREKCGNYLNSRFRILDTSYQPIVDYKSYTQGFSKAFANNLISRESCGTCGYATSRRASDITLADNILFVTEKEKQWGSSFVFINTHNGLKFFNNIKENVVVEELNKDVVIPKILHFNVPSHPHKDREKLLEVFSKKGYKAAKKYIPKPKLKKRLRRKLEKIKSDLKKCVFAKLK